MKTYLAKKEFRKQDVWSFEENDYSIFVNQSKLKLLKSLWNNEWIKILTEYGKEKLIIMRDALKYEENCYNDGLQTEKQSEKNINRIEKWLSNIEDLLLQNKIIHTSDYVAIPEIGFAIAKRDTIVHLLKQHIEIDYRTSIVEEDPYGKKRSYTNIEYYPWGANIMYGALKHWQRFWEWKIATWVEFDNIYNWVEANFNITCESDIGYILIMLNNSLKNEVRYIEDERPGNYEGFNANFIFLSWNPKRKKHLFGDYFIMPFFIKSIDEVIIK